MDRSEVAEKVISALAEIIEVEDGVELDESTSFKELGADSLDLLDLVTTLEDEFGVTLDDSALERIATVSDAVDAIIAARA